MSHLQSDDKKNATRVINESQLAHYQKTDENRAERLFHIFSGVLGEKSLADDIQVLDIGGVWKLYGFGEQILRRTRESLLFGYYAL
jgi:hypothetical protein